MYCGSWKVDDLLTFSVTTHRVDTGAATDADSAPSYRVYEDETSTPILTGTMALLDGSNTAGFYSEQITLSAANGFEKGKCYTVYISATVNSVTGTTERHFQIEAEVDANTVSPTVAANVTQFGGNNGTFSSGRPEVNASHWAGAATASDDIALKASLAKGTDLTGFNDLDAAGVRTAVGVASANLDTQLSAIAAYIDTEVAAILAAVDTEVAAIKARTDNLPDSPAAVGSAMTLSASGLDAVLVESSISASAALTNDSGTQLTSINARQAIAAVLSAVAAVLAGAATTNITMKPAAKPAGNTRIDAVVDSDGNRSSVSLKVPD